MKILDIFTFRVTSSGGVLQHGIHVILNYKTSSYADVYRNESKRTCPILICTCIQTNGSDFNSVCLIP